MSDPVDYVPFETTVTAPGDTGTDGTPELERLYDVPVELAVEIGRTQMTIRETLALGPGSIVTLNRLAGEPVDLLVNGKPIARGEVVVIDEEFGLRVTEVVAGESGAQDAPAEAPEVAAAPAPAADALAPQA
jgi:flagellar motor switch protein FliN/FliY